MKPDKTFFAIAILLLPSMRCAMLPESSMISSTLVCARAVSGKAIAASKAPNIANLCNDHPGDMLASSTSSNPQVSNQRDRPRKLAVAKPCANFTKPTAGESLPRSDLRETLVSGHAQSQRGVSELVPVAKIQFAAD